MNLDRFLLRFPKVELHVHLEGSMRPALLLELARRHGVTLPATDEAGLKRWFRFKNFEHFVEVYLTCSRCLRDPEDFYLLARDFLAEQASQNIVWSEVHFTISTHLANGCDGEGVRAALDAAITEAERDLGISMKLIPDIVRNVGLASADSTLEWALADRTGRIAAIGLAGIENGFPNEPFREHFAAARKAGFGLVAHTGEHGGPDSIRSVLDIVDPDRIDHGVQAIDDPALMTLLADRGIPLDITPTSNLCLGVYPDLPSHPFDRLRRAGLAVNVGSDDPPFFDTNLTREYARLAETFGYGPAELGELSLAALRASFLPLERKTLLEGEFRSRFAELSPSTP